MKLRYDIFLRDILDNIGAVNDFIGQMTFDQFRSDRKTIFAVCRALEIIGEASSLIPNEIKTRYPKTPWKDIKNFRNVVAHKYWEVDIDVLWDIVRNELGPLQIQIEDMLKDPEIIK
jgi:uncharacterized protein with HEPN domain